MDTWTLILVLLICLVLVVIVIFSFATKITENRWTGGIEKKYKKKIIVSPTDYLHIVQGLKNNQIVSTFGPAKIGNIIEIQNQNNGEKILAKITSIDKYKSLEECLQNEGYKNVFPSAQNFMDALAIGTKNRNGTLLLITFAKLI